MASSLSASDGWGWVVRGTQVLNQYRGFWAKWLVLQLLIGFSAGLVMGLVSYERLSFVPLALWTNGIAVLLGLAFAVLSLGFYAVGWAKALDQLGYRTFQWHDVWRATGNMLGFTVAIGLVVVAATFLVMVGVGAEHHERLMIAAVIVVLVSIPLLFLVGFLMVFLWPCLIDTTAGRTALHRAIDHSAHLAGRHGLAVLIPLLVLFGGYLGVGILAGLLRTVFPIVGELIQAVLQMVLLAVGILVFATGYVQIRGMDASGLPGSSPDLNAPAPGPSRDEADIEG